MISLMSEDPSYKEGLSKANNPFNIYIYKHGRGFRLIPEISPPAFFNYEERINESKTK